MQASRKAGDTDAPASRRSSDELAGAPGQWEPGATSPGGIQVGIVRGGKPFQADTSTIRVVKHRASERWHLYFVTFDATIPELGPDSRTFSYVFPVLRDADGGWRVRGGAGDAGDGPLRSTPWVNLAGGGWPDQFYAGGRIDTAELDIARVELRFADGLTLKDDTDAGVALFITDEVVEVPATVALLDQAGNDVATHPAFPGF
jgi:hypothetical protein